MKKQILLLCLALISLCGYAQQITVKGVVTSATDQQPLIGTTAFYLISTENDLKNIAKGTFNLLQYFSTIFGICQYYFED